MKAIEESRIEYVQNFEQVQEFFRWLGERRDWLAFDTETGGLEWWKQPLRLVQIGDTETGWVFRADRWLGVIEEVFKKYEGRMVGQNTYFDVRFLEQQGGITVPKSDLWDTKIFAHAIDPTKSTSLKALGARFLSPKAKKLQGALAAAMAAQKWGWADIPYDFDIYWGYAGLDVILTARIAEYFWPQIEQSYLPVVELENEVSRICSDMEVRGCLINMPYVEEMHEQIKEYTDNLERYCMEHYGVRPSENQKVAQKLVELGVDLSKTTATGDWAMDRDVLDGLDHPLANAVLEHRKKTKIGSTYFHNFISMHDNSVLHPSINTLGARTGRMSIQNPALQTLPRGRVVRDAFVPRPGCTWLSVDFDNIEMKLLAHFCQDPKMIEAAKTSDMHAAMARIAYKDETIDKSDPRRQTFKNANFAKAYVAGAEKFAWTAGMDIEEAKSFLSFYDEEFPGVKAFQKKVENVGRHRESVEGRGYVKSPLGRIHFSEKEKLYTLVNSLIQGTAADAFKRSLVDLDNSGFGDYLLLPVHDEVDMEIPSESAIEMQKEIEFVMTQNDWTVPLTVSSSFGASWGEAK
jgi:DNA polymerase-1